MTTSVPRRRLPPIISPTKTSFTAEACAGLRTNVSRHRWSRFCDLAIMTSSYVAESAVGLSDADVISLALRERRLLLTEDKDFGDLVFRPERTVPGVVLMRIGPENLELKTVRLAAAIERYGEELFGHYVVIEEGRFRSRRLWSAT
jgi:predicted nuclease of predicted toxin-antitoxin system